MSRARRVLLHADYVASGAVGVGAAALAAVVALLKSLVVAVAGPAMLGHRAWEGLEVATSTLYSLLGGASVTSIAEELSGGQALLYLAQPLSRVEYVASWLVAGPLMLTVLYLAASLLALAVLSPGLAAHAVEPIVLGSLQVAYHSSLTLALSLLVRRRGRATTTFMLAVFGVPLAVSMAVSVLAWTLHLIPPDVVDDVLRTCWMLAIPSTSLTMGDEWVPAGLSVASLGSLAFALLCLGKAGRMEV